MSNPWKKVSAPVEVHNLSDIMSEEYAKGVQVKEDLKFAEEISEFVLVESDEVPPEILEEIEDTNEKGICNSDAVIAKVLQSQFDNEYDEEITRAEKRQNGECKVSISYDNYRNIPESLLYDCHQDDEKLENKGNKDWDRFETNEKEFASLPKRGYIIKEGEMVTKHDSVINGIRNACKVMALPPDVRTGDGAGFDMRLSNSVYNNLKEHTRCNPVRKTKMLDRKYSQATVGKGMDDRTRILLYKFIAMGMLKSVNGEISTGKESVLIHACSDQSFPDKVLPKECAIKVYKTTLNEFKCRDKYIEDDYRFKDRFTKQNARKIIRLWAEKEMHNMLRVHKIGLNCPEMVRLKEHILIMSFIGKDHVPAPKLRYVTMEPMKWLQVYNEVVDAMHKLYNVGHLVHADLSEFNILWWEKKCWFIDFSQSVQPDHPLALELLLRDCRNITNFFGKKGVPDMKTADGLFKHITGFQDLDTNMLEGVSTVYNSQSSRFEIAPDESKYFSYPFDYCWEKIHDKKATSDDSDDDLEHLWSNSDSNIKKIFDVATHFGNELKIDDRVGDKDVDITDPVDPAIPNTELDIGHSEIDKKS